MGNGEGGMAGGHYGLDLWMRASCAADDCIASPGSFCTTQTPKTTSAKAGTPGERGVVLHSDEI